MRENNQILAISGHPAFIDQAGHIPADGLPGHLKDFSGINIRRLGVLLEEL